MGARRRLSRLLAAAATTSLIATAGVALAAGPQPVAAQAAAPMLTAQPAIGLTDGAEVTFSATGLQANEWVAVSQCPTGMTSVLNGDCDVMDTNWGESDSSGVFSGTFRVDAVMTVDSDGASPHTVDCRTSGACVLALARETDEAAASVALEFAPGAPLAPPPTATVSPAEGISDLEMVSVTAGGFVWGNDVYAIQCATGSLDAKNRDTCGWETAMGTSVTAGAATFDFEASAVMSAFDGPSEVDCRQPGACELVVTQDYTFTSDKSVALPLGFDPNAEVATPTLTVEPDHDLADGDTVSVHGEGFRPNDFVTAYLCGPDPSDADCSWLGADGEVDGEGMVSFQASVWAIVSTSGGDVDCRTSAEPCELVVASSSVNSVRAGHAALHFDPDAPVAPGPEIDVSQTTNLPDDTTVTVTGSHFSPNSYTSVSMCAGEGGERCDYDTGEYTDVAADGTFTVDLPVTSVISVWDPETGNMTSADCRAEGCSIVATDGTRNRSVSVPLTFAPEAPPVDRYLDPIFDEVTVTDGVVYGEAPGGPAGSTQLTLDVYQPTGDTLAKRPAVVWLDSGWFSGSFLDQAASGGMAAYAEAFAKRGYVSVLMHYRPQTIQCCPTRDALGIMQALVDTHDDATQGVMWLKEHAADYRIDPEAIAAGGAQAGAVAAYGLAYHPAESHHTGPADVAAALPIAGMSLGKPSHEGPPVLAFHGADDLLAPLHLSQWTCADAEEMGGTCETVSYAGGNDDIAVTRQRDIIRRSSEFLAANVLEPLGYIQPDEPTDPTDPTDPTHPTHPTHSDPTHPTTPGHTGPGGTGNATGNGNGHGSGDGTGAGHGSGHHGTLPNTGTNSAPLTQLGVALAALGAALVSAAAWRKRRGPGAPLPSRLAAWRRSDDGRAAFPAVAVVGVVALVVGLLAAPGHALARQATGGTGTPASTSTTVTVTPGSDTTVTTMPMDHDDHGSTTTMGDTTSSTDPSASTTMGDPGHDHDHATTSTTMGDDPGHDHGSTTTMPAGPDNPYGFPAEWTPDQVAFATQLIHDTEAALPRFANPAILPLLGYTWITDGTTVGTFQHWINTSLIVQQGTLDPEAPESLVFRNTEDGPVLEAAMFMLSLNYNLTNIPADIAWLPGWHVHKNLCFDGNFRVIGLTVNGVCERGSNFVTPPMVHVWTVDTPCGRFAGVDENGLQCDHEHDEHGAPPDPEHGTEHGT